ncbi:hypothetical protein KY335_01955, partial [Candidatus Woesearchaeota archaeon]|nr:hypothetical protein [Candidatus Woesearchaeota archaeon]
MMKKRIFILFMIFALILIVGCSKPAAEQQEVTIGLKECEFRSDQTLKSALEERINFSQENVSATIFKVLEDMDFDNIIIKGAVVYFTSNDGKTENLYRLDLATNLLERLIVNVKTGKIQKVQSVYNPNMYGKYIVFNDLSESPGPLRDAVKSKIIICDLESGKKDTVDRTENA